MYWKNIPDIQYVYEVKKRYPEINNLESPKYKEILFKINSHYDYSITGLDRKTGSDLISEAYKFNFPVEFMRMYKNAIYTVIELNKEIEEMIKLQDISE